MKRSILILSVIQIFLLSACGGSVAVNDLDSEEDYAVEIENGSTESDGQIVNAGKTQEAFNMQDDVDSDLIHDESDNCPTVSNPHQEDSNDNGVGDACED